MRREHLDVQKSIKQKYGDLYEVAVELDKTNYLPDRERHWYQPDVILRNKQGVIKYIVEVENDPFRKALVGASILADCSIAELQQNNKPRLIFVVYTEKGIRQILNFIEKLKIAKQYCTHLESIEIYPLKEFEKLRL
jgi:hypothetical protein